MKTRLFPALLLAAAVAVVVAVVARAQSDAPQPVPEPSVIAQLEIRGIAPLVSQAARIAAPFVPPDQLEGAVKGFLSMTCPVDVLSLVGETSAEPIRAVVYAKPGADAPGLMLDLPAADGDIDAFFDVVARSCPSSAIPAAVAAHLPLAARMVRLPSSVGLDDPRLLLLPHGSRVAVWPLACRGGVSPIQAARIVSSFPSIDAEGVVAFRFDSDAVAALADRAADAFSDAADSFRTLPASSVSVGIGLDGDGRFRLDETMALRPGTAWARYYSSIGAPAPFVNAVLFPDALAASVGHADSAIADRSFVDELLAPYAKALDDPDTRAFRGILQDFLDLLPAFASLAGNDAAAALYPPANGKAFPWAVCAARPDGVDSPSAFATRVNDIAQSLLALVSRALEAAPANADASNLPSFSLVPRGERAVAGVPVQTFAFHMDPADGDDDPPADLFAFDIALAGPALILSDLPDDRLADALSALAPDAPARPGIESIPAFAAAYGDLPPNASAVVVRLVPLLRTTIDSAAKFAAIDIDGVPDADDISEAVAPYLDALSGIDLPVASTIRPGDAPGNLRETISFPLSDLHSLATSLLPLLSPSAPAGW